MTITCDTELSEILDNNTICDPMIQLNNKAQGLLETRTGALSSSLQTGGGCGADQTVDDVPVFYNAGKELYDKYGAMSESVSSYATSVCQLAITTELDELGELSDAVVKKINTLNTEIEESIKEYNDYLKENKIDAMTGEPPYASLISFSFLFDNLLSHFVVYKVFIYFF